MTIIRWGLLGLLLAVSAYSSFEVGVVFFATIAVISVYMALSRDHIAMMEEAVYGAQRGREEEHRSKDPGGHLRLVEASMEEEGER